MVGTSGDSRVVWVTGAGSGMGSAYARRFGAEGARVACMDVDADAANAIAAEVSDGTGDGLAVECDVADWKSMTAAAARAGAELGPVDVVIANAGIIGPAAATVDLDPADWARVIGVNLTGVFHTSKAAVPQLRGRGGSMVLVSSISGLRGYADWSAYNASKHGVIGLMRTLANELAGDGVRVNSVCPGWVDTPMFDVQVEIAGITKDEAVGRWAPDQLVERLISPDEVADAVLWLSSPQAATITGVALPVDGGMLERTLPQ